MGELAKEILPVNIEDELKQSYLDYAMSVIVGRALPDVRDGLKPVHRRVLFAMSELNNDWNKAYKKSARVVGDVIGKYHPHGDSAVYDTIVRMAQPFSLRYPLVNGQGNFGSIDGDNAAAMRYTEIRMEKIAHSLLADLEKETVDFVDNYDGTERIPEVMPTRVPNLLVNGSSGIAVGMATNIPPHNLTEVVRGCLALIDNPDLTCDELMEFIPGPDFPTEGIINGRAGIVEAYRTGRGRVYIRARHEVEHDAKTKRDAVIITELPYQLNKARLIEKIAELVKEKRLEGLTVALANIDEMIELIKASPSSLEAKEKLMARGWAPGNVMAMLERAGEDACRPDDLPEVFGLRDGLYFMSPEQTQAILDMRLHRLTGLETEKLQNEYREILEKIAGLLEILGDPDRLMQVIREELEAVVEEFGDERRTEITSSLRDLTIADLIDEEDLVVTISHSGYAKTQAVEDYQAQRRGGRGKAATSMKDEDFVEKLLVANSHDTILCFSNRGKVYWLRVFEIPRASRASRGRPMVNILPLDEDERITTFLPVRDYPENQFVLMATSAGVVKKTRLPVSYTHLTLP